MPKAKFVWMATWGCFAEIVFIDGKISNFTAFKLSWVLSKKATGLLVCDHILSGSWIFEDAQWRTSNINEGKAEQQMQQHCHPLCGRFVWETKAWHPSALASTNLQTKDGSSQGQNTKTELNSIGCAVRQFKLTVNDHRWAVVVVYNTNYQPPTMQSGDSLTVTSIALMILGWAWWWEWSTLCFTPLAHATTHDH